MGLMSWLLFIAILFPFVASMPLTTGRRNVCSYVCGIKTYKEAYRQKYQTRCFIFRCTRHRTRYRVAYSDVSCNKCCDGWKKGIDSDQCLIPSNKGCGPVACDSTNSDYTCWKCCEGWREEDCRTDINECANRNGGCSDICTNTPGSYVCECLPGYKIDSTGFKCEDINECEDQNGGCSHTCVNRVGTHLCECPAGHELTQAGSTCKDIDECLTNNGGCSDICVNSAGSFECKCTKGYRIDGTSFQCEDIDECSINNGRCSDTCENTIGSFVCKCPEGYALDGSRRNCLDIDECYEKTDNCQMVCRNVPGTFECACENGYDEAGSSCTDIDECLNLNGGCSDTCVNTVGSYKCECPTGWQLGGGRLKCVDVNECQRDNGECEQRCVNTQGSFYCECHQGFHRGKGDNMCRDVNECDTMNGGCQEECVNTDGSYYCSCATGFQLAEDKRGCEDKDECSLGQEPCKQICKNTAGSYECGCLTGYKQNGTDCIDEDECLENKCEHSCTNTAGSFLCGCPPDMFLDTNGLTCSDEDLCAGGHGCQQVCNSERNAVHCSCLPGYQLIDSKQCEDIDECRMSTDDCSHICANTDGSFTCQCPEGILMDTDLKTCVDPCLPNPCQHGGKCYTTKSGVACNCSETTYTGDRCQKGVVYVSIDGPIQKGREQSVTFHAKPDSSIEIEAASLDSKLEVSPTRVSILHPNQMAKVTVKGLEAGFETLTFALSGIAAPQYNQPDDVVVYVHDVFSMNNITDFTLPVGTYQLETSLQEKIDVVFTSSRPWYTLRSDSDTVFSMGIVHMETGNLQVPISFRGVELKRGGLPRPVSSVRTENDGDLQPRRRRRALLDNLLPDDLKDLWDYNSIFRTLLKLLKPHLPAWLSLEVCGDPSYNVVPIVNIMPGLQTAGIPSCSGAPVFDDHLYVVAEIPTDMCISVLDDRVTIYTSSEKHVCLMVDLEKFHASTIIVMLPDDSATLLQNLKIFSIIKEKYGITINVRGFGFSLVNGLNVKDYKFSRNYWVGDRYFTAPAIGDASVWLDVSGEYEQKNDILELKGAGEMELALTAPDELVTQPLLDRIRFHVGARAGVLDVYLDMKGIKIHLKPKLNVEMRAYAAVGGGEVFAQEECGPDPAGVFVSCHLEFNPFDIPILSNFIPILDLSVTANVYATTDITVMKGLIVPKQSEAAIQQMRDVVLDLVNDLKTKLKSLVSTVSSHVWELLGLIESGIEKIEDVISGIVEDVQDLNLASFLGTFTSLVEDIRAILGEIEQVVGALAYNVEAHVAGIVREVNTFVENVTKLISETQWSTIQYAASVQGGVNGFGIKVSGTLKIFKLVFGGLDLEFVYSEGLLGRCARFNNKFSLLQGQEAFRIMGFLRKYPTKFLFFRLEKGAGIEMAYGLETRDVVAAFRARWAFLGFEVDAETYISKEYVGANMVATVYKLFRFEAEVRASITKEMRLVVKATFLPGPEGFDGSLKKAIHMAADELADAAAERLSKVQRGLDVAQEAMQKGIDWLDKKKDQVDDLNKVFDRAVAKLREARRKVADLQKPIDDALEKVRDVERKLDKMCKIRKCGKVCIPGIKCKWCKKGWFPYPCCRRTNCMLKIPDFRCYIKNAACMIVRGLAYVALQIAKVGLNIARIPFQAAQLALRGAEIVVDKSRVVLDIAKGILEVAKGALKTAQIVAEAAKHAVELAKILVRGALKFAALLLDVLLPIDVRRCGFLVELSTKDLFVFGIDCEINLFHTGWFKIKFKVNFGNLLQSLLNIARELVQEFASKLGQHRRKREIYATGSNRTDADTEPTDRIVLTKMDFADGLTQDEIRIREFAEKCERYEHIAQFLSTAVDALFEAANESKTTLEDIHVSLDSLQAMTYTNTTNMTLEEADIDVDEALREYNLTRNELEIAVNDSVVKMSETDMFKTVGGISSWNQDMIKDQMADIEKYPLISTWKEAMENVTKENFDEEECLEFVDCVIVSFINLHLLYDGFDLPGSNSTRMMIHEVEQQFASIMLNSNTVTPKEAYTFSHDVLELLEEMNSTKVFCASPPVIVTNPQNISVLAGDSFQLTCEATADPDPTYSWKRNEELLEGHATDKLSIGQASRLDAGDYTCIATNHLLSTVSQPARVTIEWAPEILSKLESLEILMGLQDDVVLVCNVSASPEAIISWFKEEHGEGGATVPSVEQTGLSPEYNISRPPVSNSGKYWCTAENKHGTAISNKIDMTVRHVVVPTITTTLQVGFIVTQREGYPAFNVDDLEQDIAQAIKSFLGLGSSVSVRWGETGSSGLLGLVSIHIVLNNDATNTRMSRQILRALHRHNLDKSLASIRKLRSAAYAEKGILISAFCNVTYDPSQLNVKGPYTSCPEMYEEIGDSLCAQNPCENSGRNFCPQELSSCFAAGGSNYYTFDGVRVHYKGDCKYILTERQTSENQVSFRVTTKNEHRQKGLNFVTHPKYAEIEVYGAVFRLAKDNNAYVNGDIVRSLPYRDDKNRFSIVLNGFKLRFETDFGLVVEFSDNWFITVRVPKDAADQVDGLCRDFNGIASDDFVIPHGQDVTYDPNRDVTIASRFQIDDPEEPNCTPATRSSAMCDDETTQIIKSNAYCGFISDKSGPFTRCISSAPKKLIEIYMEGCIYDVCAVYDADEAARKRAKCGSLAAFAEICTSGSSPPSIGWKDTAACLSECAGDLVYKPQTTACRITCENPDSSKCSLPDIENCVCERDTDVVVGEDKCAHASICGCFDGEREIGEVWCNKESTLRHECVRCTECARPIGEVVSFPVTDPATQCPVLDPCATADCGDEGACVQDASRASGYKCECCPQWGGEHCEVPMRYNCQTNNPCTADNTNSALCLKRPTLFFLHDNPGRFVQCSMWGQCFNMWCPPGLVWNIRKLTCDWP